MSEMIERVARAIAGHFGPVFEELPEDRKAQRLSIRKGDAYCDTQNDMLDTARAAILAMREPTEPQLAVMCDVRNQAGREVFAEDWRAMIDAIL